MLGLAVRSVQLMVDRGDLTAWKTPGGHRRISRESIEKWVASRGADLAAALSPPGPPGPPAPTRAGDRRKILLIEDSIHYQNLVSLLIGQRFPEAELHMAPDGIVGMALYGQLQPEILLVDILLPGIDGAALITTLRSRPEFARSRLIVVTSLDPDQRKPYEFALEGVPVVHKSRLVTDLPPLLSQALSPA